MAKELFEALEEEWKDKVSGSSPEEIKSEVAKVALAQAELMAAKELDEDLAGKKELYSEAGAVYRDGSKVNKEKIKYMRQVLGDKGKV